MKKGITLLLLVAMVMVAVPALAYDASYLRQFVNTEVKLVVMLNEHKRKNILVYVDRIDSSNNILIGKTNFGKVHVDIAKIMLIHEQKPNMQGVYNHHD